MTLSHKKFWSGNDTIHDEIKQIISLRAISTILVKNEPYVILARGFNY